MGHFLVKTRFSENNIDLIFSFFKKTRIYECLHSSVFAMEQKHLKDASISYSYKFRAPKLLLKSFLGDTVTIYVFLDGGLESVVSKDKFLILYQRKGDATSIKEFWKTHMPQHMRFDYK